jgi:hypothetical protein
MNAKAIEGLLFGSIVSTTLTIKTFSHGVKCLEYKGLKFLTQNPDTGNYYAALAKGGAKVTWVLYNDQYVANIIDGKLTIQKYDVDLSWLE